MVVALNLALIAGLYTLLQAFAGNNPYYILILSLAAVNVIMATSLNLIYGYTGMFSIGHAAFMAIGGYVSAVLSRYFGVPYLPAMFVGALAAALMGIVVGLPTLRLRGDYLAIATLGFGEIIRVVIQNISLVNIGKVAIDIGGPRGFMGIPRYTTFWWSYLFAVLTVVVVMNLMKSTHGRACIAIREDEVAAEAMGIPTTYYKVSAFAIGSFFAGLGGGLFAHLYSFLHPDSFGFLKSVDFLLMVVIGGLGNNTGAILAAVLLTVLNEVLRKVFALRMVTYSLLLVLIMLTRPQGLMGELEFSTQGALRFARTLLRGGPASVLRRSGRDRHGSS